MAGRPTAAVPAPGASAGSSSELTSPTDALFSPVTAALSQFKQHGPVPEAFPAGPAPNGSALLGAAPAGDDAPGARKRLWGSTVPGPQSASLARAAEQGPPPSPAGDAAVAAAVAGGGREALHRKRSGRSLKPRGKPRPSLSSAAHQASPDKLARLPMSPSDTMSPVSQAIWGGQKQSVPAPLPFAEGRQPSGAVNRKPRVMQEVAYFPPSPASSVGSGGEAPPPPSPVIPQKSTSQETSPSLPSTRRLTTGERRARKPANLRAVSATQTMALNSPTDSALSPVTSAIEGLGQHGGGRGGGGGRGRGAPRGRGAVPVGGVGGKGVGNTRRSRQWEEVARAPDSPASGTGVSPVAEPTPPRTATPPDAPQSTGSTSSARLGRRRSLSRERPRPVETPPRGLHDHVTASPTDAYMSPATMAVETRHGRTLSAASNVSNASNASNESMTSEPSRGGRMGRADSSRSVASTASRRSSGSRRFTFDEEEVAELERSRTPSGSDSDLPKPSRFAVPPVVVPLSPAEEQPDEEVSPYVESDIVSAPKDPVRAAAPPAEAPPAAAEAGTNTASSSSDVGAAGREGGKEGEEESLRKSTADAGPAAPPGDVAATGGAGGKKGADKKEGGGLRRRAAHGAGTAAVTAAGGDDSARSAAAPSPGSADEGKGSGAGADLAGVGPIAAARAAAAAEAERAEFPRWWVLFGAIAAFVVLVLLAWFAKAMGAYSRHRLS